MLRNFQSALVAVAVVLRCCPWAVAVAVEPVAVVVEPVEPVVEPSTAAEREVVAAQSIAVGVGAVVVEADSSEVVGVVVRCCKCLGKAPRTLASLTFSLVAVVDLPVVVAVVVVQTFAMEAVAVVRIWLKVAVAVVAISHRNCFHHDSLMVAVEVAFVRCCHRWGWRMTLASVAGVALAQHDRDSLMEVVVDRDLEVDHFELLLHRRVVEVGVHGCLSLAGMEVASVVDCFELEEGGLRGTGCCL